MSELNQAKKDNTLWFINFGQPLISLLDQQKNLLELTSQLSKNLTVDPSIFQISRQISISLEQFGVLTKSFFQSIEPFQQQIAQFREIYLNLAKAVHQDFYIFGELAKKLRDFSELEKEVLIQSGWWVTPIFNDLPYNMLTSAVKSYKMGDKNSMTRFFKQILHQSNFYLLKEMINSWKNKPLFKPRMKTINQALNAHIRGDYNVSVPALLALSEGIAEDFCKRKGLLREKQYRSKGGIKITKAISIQREDLGFKLYLPEIFLYHIQNIIFADTDLIKNNPNKKILNRHNILHGKIINYGDAARSLRCFLLLDVLSVLDKDKN